MMPWRYWRGRFARRSMASRLLVATLVMVIIGLPIAGLLLSHHYRASATDAFDERLEALLNVVIAGVAFDRIDQRLTFDRDLGDPRFDQVFSGWYWQITDDDQHTITSRSLWDQRLPVHDDQALTARSVDGPRASSLRLVERDIQLAPLEQPLHVSVAAQDQALVDNVRQFQQWLWAGLAGLGALLMLVLALQIRWGLAPLRRMRANLRDVEHGRAQQLNTQLPEELASLAVTMNAVLVRDQRLIESSRHAAGNLAHALKTPLSVLRLLARQAPTEQQGAWEAELSRIDSAVRHHLARASAAGEGGRVAPVSLNDALDPLITGLARLAQRRNIRLQHSLKPDLQAHIDIQDAQEIVGNILDNALRWAKHEVVLTLETQGPQLQLSVSDDGPGMTAEDCQAALQRGKRLDEQRSGSGLGLSIVADLVALYHGDMQLQRAATGGLAVIITLPVMMHDDR